MRTHSIKCACIVALASVLLSACGGDGDAPGVAAPLAASDAVPDAAAQGAEGMAAWISQLAVEDAEAKEPLDVARFTPPTAEDTEPLAVN